MAVRVRERGAARCAALLLAALLLSMSHYTGQHGALGCRVVPHWCGGVRRTWFLFQREPGVQPAHRGRHAGHRAVPGAPGNRKQ